MTTGAEALRRFAPAAGDAIDAVIATMWADAAAAGLVGLVSSWAGAAGDLLHVEPLSPTPSATRAVRDVATADDRAVGEFATQACLDVASVTHDQRAAFLAAAGDRAGTLAAALWVVEFVPRTRAALDALFAHGHWAAPVAAPTEGGVWSAIDRLIRAVPALDALDPVTSELIRLRGARQHACRLCRSLRSRSALHAGATDADFDAVDHYQDSDLSRLARAALALCDAMVWTPGHIGDDVVAAMTAEATPAQRVEVVLDVTRNALNKVAVALGADAAHVEDGVEIYDVADDGSLVYGLDPD